MMLFPIGKSEEARSDMRAVTAVPMLVFFVLGAAYLLGLLNLGLLTATMLYSLAVYSLLTPSPLKHWRTVVIPALLVTAMMWVLFAQVLAIVLPRTLLF